MLYVVLISLISVEASKYENLFDNIKKMGNYIEGTFIYALLLRESCAWCLFCYRLVLLLLLEDIC